MSTRGRPRPRAVRRIAIIDWSHLIEDYLDGIGADLHDLRDELTGGWLFGMVDALGSVDVRTTLVTISGQVPERLRWRHRPTGATISLLPAPAAYRRIRRSSGTPTRGRSRTPPPFRTRRPDYRSRGCWPSPRTWRRPSGRSRASCACARTRRSSSGTVGSWST